MHELWNANWTNWETLILMIVGSNDAAVQCIKAQCETSREVSQTKSVFLSHSLVPHIYQPQYVCAQATSSAHKHHIVLKWCVQAFLPFSCLSLFLKDKWWKLLKPPPVSWVLFSFQTLAGIALACSYLLKVDRDCDFSSLSCSTSVNHQYLYTFLSAYVGLLWFLLRSLSSHHHL